MGFIYLLIYTFAESTGKTIDKLNFARNRVTSIQLMLVIFFAISASLLLFITLTNQPVPHFSPASLGLMAMVVLVSFGANVFDFVSLRLNDLSLREPLVDFEPITAGLVGYVLFPAERKTVFLVAFILSAFIVHWGTSRRKLRASQKKGLFYLLLAVGFYAILPSLYKLTLTHITPVYIAFLRTAAVFLLMAIFFPVKSKRWKGFSHKKVAYGLLSGVAYAVGTVAGLYAIKVLGVVLTMVFMLLGPATRYWASHFILKEKVRRGEMISSLLLAAVAVAALIA
jgi:drug/metabolite transporter (DMT)-like permease